MTGLVVAAIFSGVATPLADAPVFNAAQNHTAKAATATENAFIKKAARQAQKAAKRYGVYPSVMIAQAIVESDWGKSGLAVNANNLFGMKANDSWDGQVYTARTREENSKGKSYYVNAKFRKYSSYEGSFDDNGKKLRLGVTWQPTRYEGTWIEDASSPAAATKSLTGTYATDHKYNQALDNQISRLDLIKYDPTISKTNKKYRVGKNAATYAWPTDHNVSAKAGSISKGKVVTVDKTITYYNGKKRMHIKGNGWVNSDVFTKASSQAPKSSKVNKTLMHTAYVYDAKGKRIKKRKALKEDKVIATYGKKTIKGRKFYRISKNEYVAAGNIDGTMRLLKHNAYVYNGSGNRDNNLRYKKNRSLATYGSAVKIMGKKFYKIGIHQYVKVANFA